MTIVFGGSVITSWDTNFCVETTNKASVISNPCEISQKHDVLMVFMQFLLSVEKTMALIVACHFLLEHKFICV